VTTVEVVVAEGHASALAKGNIVVAARQIERLREIVSQIVGGPL
jgi:hypothetical protein